MRDVAVVSFAQSPSVRNNAEHNEVEILLPVVREAIERSGIPRGEIGFTCSGSCDYLAGQPRARRILTIDGKDRGFPQWWEGMQVLVWE